MGVQRRDELSVETKQGQVGTHQTEAWRKEWRSKARPPWGLVNRKNSGTASEKPTGEVAQEPAKQHRRVRMINSSWFCDGFPSILYVTGWRRGSSGAKVTGMTNGGRFSNRQHCPHLLFVFLLRADCHQNWLQIASLGYKSCIQNKRVQERLRSKKAEGSRSCFSEWSAVLVS